MFRPGDDGRVPSFNNGRYTYFFADGFAEMRPQIEIRKKRRVGDDGRPEARRRDVNLAKRRILDRQVNNIVKSEGEKYFVVEEEKRGGGKKVRESDIV